MSDQCSLRLGIGPEEDRRPEDTLKSSHQPTILRTALLHPEDLEHLGGTAKRDRLFSLPDRQCRQENGNQPILAPGDTILRMAGHLQQKLPIAALVQQSALNR